MRIILPCKKAQMCAQSSARSGEGKAIPQLKAFPSCLFIRFSHGPIWNLNRATYHSAAMPIPDGRCLSGLTQQPFFRLRLNPRGELHAPDKTATSQPCIKHLLAYTGLEAEEKRRTSWIIFWALMAEAPHAVQQSQQQMDVYWAVGKPDQPTSTATLPRA